MDTDFDLATAGREALPALIVQKQAAITEQQSTITQSRQRLAALETRLDTRGAPGIPLVTRIPSSLNTYPRCWRIALFPSKFC